MRISDWSSDVCSSDLIRTGAFRLTGDRPMTAMLSLIDSKKTGTMDRQKALEAALSQIDSAFGKGSAMKLGSREKIEIEAISTGSLGLDIALGIGGMPRGRLVGISGPESSGQTKM